MVIEQTCQACTKNKTTCQKKKNALGITQSGLQLRQVCSIAILRAITGTNYRIFGIFKQYTFSMHNSLIEMLDITTFMEQL